MVILPGAGLAAGGVIGAGLSELAVNLSNKIGRSFPDNLYIQVDGEKVWPADSKSHDVKAGDRVVVGFKFDLAAISTVSLRERDVILSDDYLFEFQVSPHSVSGLYAQKEPTREKGCMYVVDVEIVP